MLVRVKPETIPRVEKRILCATFLEAVIQFFKDPENMAAYEIWHNTNNTKGGTAYRQEDRGSAAEGASDLYPAEGSRKASRRIPASALAAGGGGT